MKNILLPFLRFFSIVIILVSFPIALSFIGLMTVPLRFGWVYIGYSPARVSTRLKSSKTVRIG